MTLLILIIIKKEIKILIIIIYLMSVDRPEQSGPGARNTYSTICSYRIGDCCCSIEVSYVVYIH